MLLSFLTSIVWPMTISKEPKLYRYDDPSELMEKAEDYMNRNVNDSALLYFTAILGLFPEKIPDEHLSTVISAHNGIGLIHYMNGNYSDAYSSFVNSIDLDERADSPGYINLAGLFHFLGDNDKCIEYLQKGFEAAAKNNNQYYLCLTFINLVNSTIESGNFSYLNGYANLFRETLSDKNSAEGRYGTILAHAAEMAKTGKYQDAVRCLKTAPQALNGFFLQDRAIFDTNVNIGRLFIMANMKDSAMLYMKKAESLADEKQQPDMMIEITKDLSSLSKATGDIDGYRNYRYKWLELQDSIYFNRGLKDVHDLEMGYEARRFGKKIEQLTIEKNFRMKLIILYTAGIVILTVMLVIVLKYNKKLRSKNHDLFQKNLAILVLKKTNTDMQRACGESHTDNDISHIHEHETSTDESVLSSESTETYTGTETDISIDPGKEEDYDKNNYNLSENYMETLWGRIETIMADEKIFCDPDFTMHKLSEILNCNTKYISQTINWKTNHNFTTYLGEKRLDVACRRFIDNETYGHLTLEAIIKGVGYKSRSSFVKTFKRYTGLTPSEYRKIALEKANANTIV